MQLWTVQDPIVFDILKTGQIYIPQADKLHFKDYEEFMKFYDIMRKHMDLRLPSRTLAHGYPIWAYCDCPSYNYDNYDRVILEIDKPDDQVLLYNFDVASEILCGINAKEERLFKFFKNSTRHVVFRTLHISEVKRYAKATRWMEPNETATDF